MTRYAVSVLCLGFLATAAHGQLASERTDGVQRVCLYRDLAGSLTNAGAVREHRVGLAESCPYMAPNPGAAQQMPPTARLAADAVSGTRRQCTYTEAGLSWVAQIPVDRSCPLAAGMLPREPDARR